MAQLTLPLPSPVAYDDLVSHGAADPLVGTTFADRFVIQECLGRGGMAVVYRARDELTGHDVALKLLPAGLGESEELVARFKREMRASTRLEHPNIVHTYAFGEGPEGRLFLALELLDGRSLSEVVQHEAPLPPRRIARIGEQLARALAAAHAAGVMHRDLKPDNVVLLGAETGQDRVKLLDLGLARFIEEEADKITATGSVVGTPLYMAPEYLETSHQDERGDLYGLGVLLYELATGRPPYQGRLREILEQHARGEMPPSPAQLAQTPTWLDALIMSCLSPSPDGRPPSAEAAAEALSEGLALEDTGPARRSDLSSWLLLGLGVFLVITTFGFLALVALL